MKEDNVYVQCFALLSDIIVVFGVLFPQRWANLQDLWVAGMTHSLVGLNYRPNVLIEDLKPSATRLLRSCGSSKPLTHRTQVEYF
jgi:hypothetical protein